MTEVIQALVAPIIFMFIMFLVEASLLYVLLLFVRIVRQGIEWVKGVL